MAEIPKKTGLDVTWQFLNTITGNADAVFKTRQAELQAYDSELKREQAVLNVAQGNIDNAKMSRFIALDIQERPDDFASMDNEQFTAYIDSVPSQAGIDMSQYSDPLSKINLISNLKKTENAYLDKIQVLRTNKATNDGITDLSTLINSFGEPEIVNGELIVPDQNLVNDSLDALHEKVKLTGGDPSKVNEVLIKYAKEQAKLNGDTNPVVNYIMNKRLGKDSDRNTMQKDIDAYKHEGEYNIFTSFTDADLTGGLSNIKPAEIEKRYNTMYTNANDTNKTKITNTIGDALLTRIESGETVSAVLNSPMGKSWVNQNGRITDPTTAQALLKAAKTEQKTNDIRGLYTQSQLTPDNGAVRLAINNLPKDERSTFDEIAQQKILDNYTQSQDGTVTINDVQKQFIQHTKQYGTILPNDRAVIYGVTGALSEINYSPNEQQTQQLDAGMERIRDYVSQGLGDVVLGEFDEPEKDILQTALNIQQAVGGSNQYAIQLAHKVTQGNFDIKNSEDLVENLKDEYPEIGNNPRLEQFVKTNYSIFRLTTDVETAGEKTFELLKNTVITQDYQDGKIEDNGAGFLFQGQPSYAVGNGNATMPLKDTVKLIADEYLFINDFDNYFKQMAKQGISRDDYIVVLQNNPKNKNQTDVMVFYTGDDTPMGLNIAVPELSKTFENRGIFNPLMIQRMQANQQGRTQKAIEQNKQELEQIQEQGTSVGFDPVTGEFTMGGSQ